MNPLTLLGYQYNYEIEPEFIYDNNGFIIPNNSDNMNQYFFGDYGSNYSSINIVLVSKSDNKYIYDIEIIERIPSGTFIASGTVEIDYNNQYQEINKIEKIIVNGVEDGLLNDIYNDCFDIYPYKYIHILHKNNFS